MSSFESIVPIASTMIAFATVVFTTLWMSRQTREIAHERNALALIEAIDGLSSPISGMSPKMTSVLDSVDRRMSGRCSSWASSSRPWPV
jgi:hypothetical protein